MNIEHEIGETKGRFLTHGAGGVAELSYSIAGEHMIIIDHTDVPAEMKGQGIGDALFLRMVEHARAKGVKVVPLCPFAKSRFAKYPETRDVT
ncbi:GNAT family N-acetyltransferase [Aliiroseovarius sp.]|uniref:GNAT family N-acetyltransferase n=1 Tax=Aliiroseovarius sp. TaxID=1872442 RepID=UPI003BAD7B11